MIDRYLISLLARYSDYGSEEVDRALAKYVRPGTAGWTWLLRWLFLALGCGLLASGILFFFAYNWAAIPKFSKIGLAGIAVMVPGLLALIPRLAADLRKALLTAAAFLVGPLLGVIGQVYQTGADAYQLFTGWMVLILLWVLALDFAPLWLLFFAVTNLAAITYLDQATSLADSVSYFGFLTLINLAPTVLLHVYSHFGRRQPLAQWLLSALAVLTAYNAVAAAIFGIFGEGEAWVVLPVLLLVALTAAYGYYQRSMTYLVVASLSGISVVTAFILRWEIDEVANFFLATCWVTLATAGTILFLNTLRKQWRPNEA